MKSIKPLFWSGVLISLLYGNPVLGQTPASIGVQLYPGLNVTGSTGTVYAIQATTDLSQTNSWTCLTFIQLPATNYFWMDTSTPATGQRFYRAVTLMQTNMAFIPPGSFRMGSPTNEEDRSSIEGPQTVVTISRGFLMGIYPVTQSQYQSVTGSNPSTFAGHPSWPVETVSWINATNYCALLTRQQLAAGNIPTGSRYRLPTEAEWEYACRAWTSDRRFSFGDDLNYTNLPNYAWVTNNTTSPQPVGLKLPNPWGLYDMYGNVQQWCLESFGAAFGYPGGSVTDPQMGNPGDNQPYRGGSWFSSESDCRSAARGGSFPSGVGFSVGFRVVLAADH